LVTAVKKRNLHPNSLANLRPIKPGERRNPSGRPADLLSKALRRRLSKEDAERIADVLIAEAMAGNLKAIEIIWDRLEGKPVARQEHGEPGDFQTVKVFMGIDPDAV
jgi:hypothetical protein